MFDFNHPSPSSGGGGGSSDVLADIVVEAGTDLKATPVSVSVPDDATVVRVDCHVKLDPGSASAILVRYNGDETASYDSSWYRQYAGQAGVSGSELENTTGAFVTNASSHNAFPLSFSFDVCVLSGAERPADMSGTYLGNRFAGLINWQNTADKITSIGFTGNGANVIVSDMRIKLTRVF